jgi:hypothetical protein
MYLSENVYLSCVSSQQDIIAIKITYMFLKNLKKLKMSKKFREGKG